MAFNYGNYPGYNPGYSQAQPYQNQMVMMQPPPQMPLPAPQTATQPTQGISPASRPVSNMAEANAVQADFSGALMVFPDLTHNRVYIKRWNMQTGSADFGEFAPVIPAQSNEEPQKQDMAFASLQDFQDLQDLVSNLQKEVERLKKPAASGKAGKKNDADE